MKRVTLDMMKQLVAASGILLGGLMLAGCGAISTPQSTAAPSTGVSASRLVMKRQLVANDTAHHHQTGGAPYVQGTIKGPTWTGPQTVPKPQLVQNLPVPGPLTMAYHLSPTVYTDQIDLAVLAGSTVAAPSRGVIIVEYYRNNLPPVIKTIPDAGQVSIIGFNGDEISLQGSLGGHGVYDVATNSISWRNTAMHK